MSEKRPKVMFLSDMCVLDRNSGAAIEMLDWLKMLARSGYSASSVSMSLFDGSEEYPFRREVAPNVDPRDHVGKRIRLTQDGIEHNIFNVGTSIARNVPSNLVMGFVSSAAEDVRRIRPDVVIGFGSRNLVPLRELARRLGARTVFYLCNDSYTEDKLDCFGHVDEIVTPSKALADLYNERLGLKTSQVIGNYLPEFESVPRPTQIEIDGRRRAGLVTMVNPGLVKGGLFFFQIAAVMERLEPRLTFVAIESRTSREQIEGYVNNASRLRNVWWLQRQSDMQRVYRNSALLLMPSLWFEAAGRIVPEAQMHGVPILAHRVGALPEQMGQGGELIDIPARMQGNFKELPTTAEVTPWVEAIRKLMNNGKKYQEMARSALAASAAHDPRKRADQIRAFFADQVRLAGRAAVEEPAP